MTPIDSQRGNPGAPAHAAPAFGRFQLLRLVGKSARTLVWLAHDPSCGEERLLVVPRTQCADRAGLERQLHAARKAMRVTHPGLATPIEVGDFDRWPFVAYARGDALTWAETVGSKGLPAAEVAQWSTQMLDGLAFAHEAGLAHRDIQSSMVLVSETAGARLMGLEVAQRPGERTPAHTEAALSPSGLQAQRRDAERDVLAFGLVLHFALSGQHALGRDDAASVMSLMPPHGREIVRLPWSTGQPIPDPLRVIANRATDRQERQRYHSARTLARALEGWYRADAQADGGPLALLLERLRVIGPIPSLPGASRRAARLALMERERTNELAEIVLQDPALAFELLRAVNTAQVRGTLGAGSAPVLTVRRAIALVGLDGVRRAALALREWPGPLSEPHAVQLRQAIERAQQAGRIAQLLRPAGYDAEVVGLVTLLQNLGRLVAHYHFPEEAAQVTRLMQPVPSPEPGRADEPGMSEEAASFAVLGVNIEMLGAAVARHWGLDESVMHMIRRQPPGATIRALETDDDTLRASASCANEVVDALVLDARHAAAALHHVAQRYARALGLSERDLQLAAQGQLPQPEIQLDPDQPEGDARHAA